MVMNKFPDSKLELNFKSFPLPLQFLPKDSKLLDLNSTYSKSGRVLYTFLLFLIYWFCIVSAERKRPDRNLIFLFLDLYFI